MRWFCSFKKGVAVRTELYKDQGVKNVYVSYFGCWSEVVQWGFGVFWT